MFAGALMSFIACTNDEFPLEQETESNKTTEGVIFTAQKFLSAESTESRTSITPDEDGATFAWVAGDSIAIVPDEGAQIYFVIDEIDVQNADKAVFTGGAWGLKTDNEYAAYYPFIPDYSINQTNVPVDYSVQAYKPGANGTVTPSHDYMVARSVKQDGGNLKFDFTHLGALVEVKFSIPEDGTIKRLDLMTNESILPLKGTFDLTAENVTIASNPADLSNKMVVNVEGLEAQADETVSVFFMMPPMDTETFNTNMLTAVVTYGDNNDVLSFRINSDYAGLKASTYYTLGTEKMVFRPAKKDLHDMVDKATYDNYKEKVRFVTGSTHLSGDKIYDGDCAAYAVVNGDWAEIHTPAKTIYLPENSSALFKDMPMTELNIRNLLSDEVTDMSFMFEGCSNLVNVTMNTNTQKVTTTKAMFKGCSQLRGSALGLNTPQVTDISSMFEGCTSMLTCVLGSNLSTVENVTTMNSLFKNCSSINHDINLNDQKLSKVTDMESMFEGCENITGVVTYYQHYDTNIFNTESVTNMSKMFKGCSKLDYLVLTVFNTEKVTDMSSMFEGCKLLTAFDLSSFNTEAVTNMSAMFKDCSAAASFTFGESFNTEKVTDMSAMFEGCSSLEEISLTRFNTKKVTDMSAMFKGCSKIGTLDLSKFDFGAVTTTNSMFMNCTSLTSVDLHKFDGPYYIVNLESMFEGCTTLTSLDLSLFGMEMEGLIGSSITVDKMFKDCVNLKNLDMRSYDFGHGTNKALHIYIVSLDSIFENMGANYNSNNKATIYIPKYYKSYGNEYCKDDMINFMNSFSTGINEEKVMYIETD